MLLFADADGATKFADLEKLEERLEEVEEEGMAVVCGSRAHLEKESIGERMDVWQNCKKKKKNP